MCEEYIQQLQASSYVCCSGSVPRRGHGSRLSHRTINTTAGEIEIVATCVSVCCVLHCVVLPDGKVKTWFADCFRKQQWQLQRKIH
jgi:hypothetical protein